MRITTLPDGFEFFDSLGSSAILPILPNGEIVLVRQIRPAIDKEFLEIPAGTMDVEGESREDCAIRELAEETGYTAREVAHLGFIIPSCGRSNETIELFIGLGLSKVERPQADDKTEPVIMSRSLIDNMIRAGQISDAKTIVALHMFDMGGLKYHEVKGQT
jgi:ADP-ribose pyrophosphatase